MAASVSLPASAPHQRASISLRSVQWVIRPATDSDIAAIQDIERDAGRRYRDVGLQTIADDPPPTATELRAHVRRETAWVGELGGEAVGYALASVIDGHGHLDQVSVRVHAGGLGLGRALVETVHEWARARGAAAVTLTTFADVAFNAPFYASLGYEVLDDDGLGPELAAERAAERRRGLDLAPRVAMRCELAKSGGPGPGVC